jgi:tetratricopeptide (TPR) repeat protein
LYTGKNHISRESIVTNQEEKIESLIDEAFAALDTLDIERAIELGRQLETLRHSSCFEILALAFDADDKREEAIAVLEDGTTKAPSVWRLWQLLGNYYSDSRRLEDSMNCYRKAFECPNVDASSVYLNKSIALLRNQDYLPAIKAIDQVSSEALQPLAISHKMHLFNAAKMFSEAVTLGENAIDLPLWNDENTEQLAEVHSELAFAIWKSSLDRDRAQYHAWLAISIDKSETTAAWVIRDIAAETSPKARHMTVMIRGRWHVPFEEETEPPGFFANYEVVAETPEEALAFILPFEPEKVRDSLGIEEYTLREPAPGVPKGVYQAHPSYMMFPWVDEV